MTEYEQANGIVPDAAIKKYVKDWDYSFTKNPDNALWVLRDGSMISNGAEQNYGVRSEDHAMVEDLISEGRYDDNFYAQIQAKTQMLRVVPETGKALIAEDQPVTQAQKKFLAKTGFQLTPYVKSEKPTPNKNLTKDKKEDLTSTYTFLRTQGSELQ